MKLFTITFLALLLCVACEQKKDSAASLEVAEPIDPMEGAWEQTDYYSLVNGDTVFSTADQVQHKFYINGHVIWAYDSDSTQIHGYGTYDYANNTVTETLLLVPPGMNTDQRVFELKIDFGENSYSQIIESVSNDTTYQSIEVYKRLSK